MLHNGLRSIGSMKYITYIICFWKWFVKSFLQKTFGKRQEIGKQTVRNAFCGRSAVQMPPKHRKRQTFHSTSEEAEKYKPFGLKTRFPGADLLPAKLLRVLHYGQKKLRIPVLCKDEQQLINGGLRLPLRALLGQ